MIYTVRFGYDIHGGGPMITEMGAENDLTFPSYEEAAQYGQTIRKATGLLRLRYMVFSQETANDNSGS